MSKESTLGVRCVLIGQGEARSAVLIGQPAPSERVCVNLFKYVVNVLNALIRFLHANIK